MVGYPCYHWRPCSVIRRGREKIRDERHQATIEGGIEMNGWRMGAHTSTRSSHSFQAKFAFLEVSQPFWFHLINCENGEEQPNNTVDPCCDGQSSSEGTTQLQSEIRFSRTVVWKAGSSCSCMHSEREREKLLLPFCTKDNNPPNVVGKVCSITISLPHPTPHHGETTTTLLRDDFG